MGTESALVGVLITACQPMGDGARLSGNDEFRQGVGLGSSARAVDSGSGVFGRRDHFQTVMGEVNGSACSFGRDH